MWKSIWKIRRGRHITSCFLVRTCASSDIKIDSNTNPEKRSLGLKKDGITPEIPTNCCMSGCANCVWIQYAEELAKFYEDGGEKARKAIEEIDDPMMKAFLQMELKSVLKKS